MPTFERVEVEVETDNGKETLTSSVDFEVFCGRCNAGLCNQSDTRSSRRRSMPQVTVEPCERCLERKVEEAAEKVRDDLEARIAELEKELEELHTANNNLSGTR